MKIENAKITPRPQLDHSYAVQFGEKKRDNELKAFPFLYNFVRYPYQVGTPDDSVNGSYQVSAADAEGPDGITLNPNAILDIPVVMDNDFNFHLLHIKYGAFRKSQYTTATLDVGDTFAQPTGDYLSDFEAIVLDALNTTTGLNLGQVYYVRNAGLTTFQVSLTQGGAILPLTGNGTATFRRLAGVFGSREFLEYPIPYTSGNVALPGQGLVPEAIRNVRVPYWTQLDVSVYMTSSASRDLYGGFQREPLGGATVEAPLPMMSLQGSQDGFGSLRTPFQLTKSATVLIRVKSQCIYPLQVYGHLFGYKITV